MNPSSKPILCCGFTPCVQRIIEFDQMEKSAVNRAKRVTVGIGGKGANTARMVNQLGGQAKLIEFAGGANGRLLEEMLDAEGVDFCHVDVSGATRICQTLVEAGHSETTELVEEMPPLAPDEWNQMVALFNTLDGSGMVAISGKLPAGAPVDAYALVAKRVAEQGGRVVLDAPGEPLRQTLQYQPFIVKINDVELLQTMGGDDVLLASRELIGQGAQSVLITRGSRSAFYVDASRTLEIVPPKIAAVNPVGSGDAVTAGLVVALNNGVDLTEALIHGMACGAANALNLVSGLLVPADVERLKPEVGIAVG